MRVGGPSVRWLLAHGQSVDAYNAGDASRPDTCAAHSVRKTCADGALGIPAGYSKPSCTDHCNPSAGQVCSALDHLYGAPACEDLASSHCTEPGQWKDYCIYDGSQGTHVDGDGVEWPCGYCWCWAWRNSTIDCDGNCP